LRDELAAQGHLLGRDHVRRLMGVLGLEAFYPKPRLRLPDREHQCYPYLLRNLAIVRPDQVWCSDITYIRLHRGFAYLVAVMDWFSRYVLSWDLSLSLESDFCIRALEAALTIGRPEIFNTDQGCQYTALGFTQVLAEVQVQISMDGRGRAFDNITIERLWRTVKYEEVFLTDYGHLFAACESLDEYFRFYNERGRPTSLAKQTPAAFYWHGRTRTAKAG